jgi:hypothetical protein
MNFRTCNPLYGYRWFREGITLFLRQPWPWLALVGVSFLLTLILSTLPVLGLIAVFLMLPGLAAGFMLAAKAAASNQPVLFPHLIAGFRQAARPLISLGGANFLVTLMGMLIISLGWSGELSKLLDLMRSTTPDEAAIEQALRELTLPSLLSLALMLPLAMANWFAPALIVFRDMAAGTAMQLSLVASLRNFWPFLVYGILLFLLDAAVSLLLRGVLGVLNQVGGEAVMQAVGMLLVFPIVCTFFALMLSAMYVSYGDVFESKAAETVAAGAGEA